MWWTLTRTKIQTSVMHSVPRSLDKKRRKKVPSFLGKRWHPLPPFFVYRTQHWTELECIICSWWKSLLRLYGNIYSLIFFRLLLGFQSLVYGIFWTLFKPKGQSNENLCTIISCMGHCKFRQLFFTFLICRPSKSDGFYLLHCKQIFFKLANFTDPLHANFTSYLDSLR
jgi:hypothetical protein